MYYRKVYPIHKHVSYVSDTWSARFFHTQSTEALTNLIFSPKTTGEHLASRTEIVLQSCPNPSTLQQAKQIHAQSIVNGITNEGLLGGKIVGMYVLFDSFTHASKLFYQLDLYFAMPWNWMIRGLIKMGHSHFALLLYFKMLSCGVFPDKYTFPQVIKACGSLSNVKMAKIVHDTMLLMGFHMDAFVGSSLIKLYVENDYLNDACLLFDKMPQKDCVLWNVMLNGFVKCGQPNRAIQAFQDMRNCEIKPDSITFAAILSACSSQAMFEFGNQLHGLVISSGFELNPIVANTLVAMYSKFGLLSDACKLFDEMPEISLVTWNGMISGYVQNGFMDEARLLFSKMVSSGVKPDAITLVSFLPSVSQSESFMQSKEIYGYILRHGVSIDLFLKSALIDTFFKCRNVRMACKIFSQSTTIDVVLFTSMISGYVLNGLNNEALNMFRWLLERKMSPNAVTMASVLPACAGLAALKLGKELHADIIKHGLDGKFHVGSAIMDMYAKCGRLDLAHQIFQKLPEKDSVCWNAIITSCSQNGKPEEALHLFRQMGIEGMNYDCVSISAALSACANLPALHYGREIHCFMTKSANVSDVFAETALIDMYGKCGSLIAARRVFDIMQEKNKVSFNTIISAYGSHGHLEESLELFHTMLEDKIQPDYVTFLTILSACGHSGQVDKGIKYFRCMTEEFGITAQMEHYATMVDLFGRAGRLSEAFELIKSMPFSPDEGMWVPLLGACRVHGNVELAQVVSRHLLSLDPGNSGCYVLLSNIHADAGQWGNARNLRRLMKVRQVQKAPAYSWIRVNKRTNVFVVDDKSHPQSSQIYSLLNNLLFELKKEGYVPQTYLPMHPQTLE